MQGARHASVEFQAIPATVTAVFVPLRLAAILILLSTFVWVSPVEAARKKKRARAQGPKSQPAAYVLEPDAPVLVQPGMPVPPTIEAKSAIVLDPRSGRVLYDKGGEIRRQAASTQKLLTALLVAERGRLGEAVQVAPEDTHCEPSKLGLRSGEVYRRNTLLQALLVKSANDAALTLARSHSGSVEAFAEEMNRRAAQLGVTNSNFVNPNGLPAPGQYSTARDIARIARYAYYNRTIREIVATPTMIFQHPDGRVRELKNTNKVLTLNPYCNGMKTGYTNGAGHCLVCSGTYQNTHIIAVVFASKKAVWTDANALLNWALVGGG